MSYLDRLDEQLPEVQDSAASSASATVGTVPTDLPKHIRRMLDEKPGDDRSGQTYALVTAALEWGYSDAQIQALAAEHKPSTDKYPKNLAVQVQRIIGKQSESQRGAKKAELEAEWERHRSPALVPPPSANGIDAPPPSTDADVVAGPNNPVPNARGFVDNRYRHADGQALLMYLRGTFYTWTGNRWAEVETAVLRAELYDRFAEAVYLKTTKNVTEELPFQPNKRSIAYITEALQAVTTKPQTLNAPSWLDAEGPVPASELVACGNGLLHVPTRRLYAHTPRFFNHHCVPYDYEPSAAAPQRWLAFLAQLWPSDQQAIDTLQEILGYLISGDTRLQKMFLLVGPSRSGKGTIARVATQLIGPHHVAGSTLSSLATPFGLQSLVNASVTTISDARLPKNDSSVVTERLLSISGEDILTVDRKYRDHWTGKLPTRIVILTNELPRFSETSGALASRFMVLTMTRTFRGRENPDLTDQLLDELPGIFNWALDGLERLRSRGRFVQPSSSADAIRELEDLASPAGAFLRDRCVVGPEYQIAVDELWTAWKQWCEDNGRNHPGTKQTFGRELRTVVPGMKVTQPRDAIGRQYRAYQGIDVAQQS